MEKRFSIIVCAYNIEAYIEEAIKSVLGQNFTDYELILIDDCSTDNTKNILKKYESDTIKVYSTERNTGTAAGPRNIGLNHATGQYVIFLDGDDKLYNGKVLEKIDKLIADQTYDVVYLGYQDIGNADKLRVSTNDNSTKKARIVCDVTFSVSSRCWNRQFIEKHNMRFKESMYYEDELFCMTANILGEKTTYGDFPIFKYRRNRKGSVMSTPTIRKCSDWYRMLAELVDLISVTPNEYRKYLMSFIKNESDTIPFKIKSIMKSLYENTGTPVFPKREYEYDNYMEDILEG